MKLPVRWCIAVAAVAALSSVAVAQPAAALGQPLEDPSLPAGTVIVRVIGGDASVAVPTVDVSLVVNGTPRSARTNAEGRATFSDLPAGAQVQAVIAGESGEVKSEPFALPKAARARLMLSTKPMIASGGGTSAQGMPQPRQISGRARPESADPAGMLTVRLAYDDFNDEPPANHPVMVIGYTDESKVVFFKGMTDASGRAEFKGLDVTGRTAYYATTLLPRGDKVDRLISFPIQMLPGLGMRLVLSGAKRSSTEPSIDEYQRMEEQIPGLPAGLVVAAISTQREDQGGTVELVEVATGKVIATERLPPTSATTDEVLARFGDFEPEDKTPAGTVRLLMLAGSQGGPMVEGEVTLVPVPPAEGPAPANGPAPKQTTTDDKGRATFTDVAPGQYKVVVELDDKHGESPVITIPADKGGRILGALIWFEGIPPRYVKISSVPTIPEPVYVRLKVKGTTRLGLPFLPAPDHGSTAPFTLAEQLGMVFFLHGSVDDKYYGVSGEITIVNDWWTPYRAGEDGVLIPLPAGFTGGGVGEDDKTRVTPEPHAGFRIRRPLPPGNFGFEAGFSLPIKDGVTEWNFDLPWGATQSAVNLLDTPGMKVDIPAMASTSFKTAQNGTRWFSVGNIEIAPGQSMTMTIRGLPVAPEWKMWLPRFAGVVVLVLLVFTVWLTVRARSIPAGVRAAASAKIQALMDELVELERKGQGGRRKDAILAELEKLWEADGRGRAA